MEKARGEGQRLSKRCAGWRWTSAHWLGPPHSNIKRIRTQRPPRSRQRRSAARGPRGRARRRRCRGRAGRRGAPCSGAPRFPGCAPPESTAATSRSGTASASRSPGKTRGTCWNERRDGASGESKKGGKREEKKGSHISNHRKYLARTRRGSGVRDLKEALALTPNNQPNQGEQRHPPPQPPKPQDPTDQRRERSESWVTVPPMSRR